jgi:malonyl-CoA reductase/3-hydroxypropionate dehydrogenase (NADP+)
MDELQGVEPGSTGKEFRDLMITTRTSDGGLEYKYPTPTDVASGIIWLASDESSALSGHHIEVTNGMQVAATTTKRQSPLRNARFKVVLASCWPSET